MRELGISETGSYYERFANVQCTVLPKDVTEDEIDNIEADLQARPNTKLEYDWIGEARLIRRQVSKGNTSIKQVAKRLRRSERYIENMLMSLDEADLYLSDWLNKPGEYNLVLEGQQIFADIPKNNANKDQNLQDASRAIAWAIYENRKKISGRVYRLNPAFGKLSEKVLEKLEGPLVNLNSEENNGDNNEDEILIDLDGGEVNKDYSNIVNSLRYWANNDENLDILIDICETEIEKNKGVNTEQLALKTIGKVNSNISGIEVNNAGVDTLPSILKQIENIRACLDRIEETIHDRLKD